MTTTTTDEASQTAVGPSWASLASADPHTVASFYRTVLGWSITETDGRLTASTGGTPVAEITAADGVPGWLAHFDVDNLDAALAAVSGAGGTVVPSAVGDSAETTIVTDRNGTRSALRAPATRRRERPAHGTLAWGELITDDVGTSAAFYLDAFGWELTEARGSLGRREWRSHGRSFAGLLPRPPAMPAGTPAYWDVYFAVDDIDAAAKTATEHGGTQLMPPTPVEIGTITVFLDPAGAIFTLVQLTVEEVLA
ncbi:VOC family protein [Streptomyces sp. NBC_00988]|uniref:VOC family protein n=1 Tax=Streptomyces sp. NBC_00988 TaxID=2903704 RepID=UPI0038707A6D|nr:VOC family protein [Streptomyces sp. NBC_00988]